MSPILRLLASTVGRKVLMGLTGLLLIGFLAVHLAGNLLVFSSAEKFNHYSELLLSNPLIVVAELGLLALFVIHLLFGITVTLNNWKARGQTPYQVQQWARHTSHKSLASTTMIYTGIVLLVFVPLHVWTFKYGTFYASVSDPHIRDLHRLVIEVFGQPVWVAGYVAAMAIIGFHLWHGFGSAFESLGVRHRKPLRWVGQIIALVLAGGFLLIPVLVFFMGETL